MCIRDSPNLFKATVNFPGYAGGDVELTSFLCKGAQLPTSVMNPIEVPFRGRQLKIAGDRTFENWTVTVLNDTDFNTRDSMERWMNGMNAHSANTGLANPVLYETDLKVEQLDRAGESIKEYVFRGSFPVDLSPIDVGYGLTDDIERFTVTFQYQYFDSLNPATTT